MPLLLTNTPQILLAMKPFNAESSNSGKGKAKKVVRDSSEQSPLPPAAASRNQFHLFRFNAGGRGNGNHFPSPSNFPPLSNGHRFASPSNVTPLPNSQQHFASPNNLTPLSNGSQFAFLSNLTPPSIGHQFTFPTNSTPTYGNHFASTSNFVSPSKGRHDHSQVERILNSAAPAIRPYNTFTSLLMADDNENGHEDPMVTEMRSQSENINQIITTHAKLLGHAVGGMLKRQQKSLHHASDEQANKKLKQKEVELEIKSAYNEDLEKKVEHYKKEAERLSARLKYMEDYTKSLKSFLGRASMPSNYSEANHGDSSSSPPFIDPDTVGGAIIIECMVCNTQLASVMMLPCRHVSVCKRCDAVTKACPACCKMKLTSAEAVIWPL